MSKYLDCLCVKPYSGEKPKRNWAPLREKAKKRAKISLKQVWQSDDCTCKISHAVFEKFCFKDYKNSKLSIIEKPHTIAFRVQTKDKSSGHYTVFSHFIVSFRHGRTHFYKHVRLGNGTTMLRHTLPENLRLHDPINVEHEYAVALSRFEKTLIKMLRAKARSCGTKMAMGKQPSLKHFLMCSVYPGYKDFWAAFQSNKINSGKWVNMDKLRFLLPAMRHDPSLFVRKAVGYDSRVVKKLFWGGFATKELIDHVSRLSWLSVIRRHIPIDYTQQILASSLQLQCPGGIYRKQARQVLTSFSPKRVLSIFQDATNFHYVNDAINLVARIREKNPAFKLSHNFKTITELHDDLTSTFNKIRYEDFPINTDYAKDVEGIRVGGYTIVAPKTSHELMEWGRHMSNCIGGYARWINNGLSWILGLRSSEGKVEWGIELRPDGNEIAQFRGKFNEEAPAILKLQVEEILREKRLLGQLVAQDKVERAAAVLDQNLLLTVPA